MDQPLVSIVLASYNHEAFVVETLESIHNQIYKNWEVIIADDASSDNSVNVINEWLSSHDIKATTIFHKQNTGLCQTINECHRFCKGSYIKFIAADDVMDPYLLEKSVAALESAGEEYGLVYSNAQIIDGKSEKQNSFLLDLERDFPQGWVRDDLYKGNFVPALTALVRRSVYKHLGEHDTGLLVEDYEYWMRMSAHYKFLALKEVLGYYRVHGSNISLRHNVYDDLARIMIKYDTAGNKVTEINKAVIDRFNYGNVSPALLKEYLNYSGRTKWLTYSLKNKLSYSFFRIINKLFGIQ